MRRQISSIGAAAITLAALALSYPGAALGSVPVIEMWTKQFGTSKSEWAGHVAVDGSARAWVLGSTEGKMPGAAAALGTRDAYLRKYSRSGAALSTYQFGTNKDDNAAAVSVDRDGFVLVAGWTAGRFPGQTRFGGGDAFVRKSASNGNVAWVEQFGTAERDAAYGVDVDHDSKSVYVVGYTMGNLARPVKGSSDAFLAKFSSNGKLLWTRQFGTGKADEATGVAVDDKGKVIVTGWTEGRFAGQADSGGRDAFVRKYAPDGSVVWTNQFGTVLDDEAYYLEVDSSRRVFVVGATLGAFPGEVNAGGWDGFLARFTSGGASSWAVNIGTGDDDLANDVAVDGAGDAFVAGYWGGTAGWPKSPSGDAFVSKHASGDGSVVWSEDFGSDEDDAAIGIAWFDVLADANPLDLYVVGSTLGEMVDGQAKGSSDAFVRRYSES